MALTLRRRLKCDTTLRPRIDTAIEVRLLSLYLDIRFIHAPRGADQGSEALPFLFEVRSIPFYPSPDRAGINGDTALGHHFRDVCGGKLILQIPPDGDDNDLRLEVPSFEHLLKLRTRAHHPTFRPEQAASS